MYDVAVEGRNDNNSDSQTSSRFGSYLLSRFKQQISTANVKHSTNDKVISATELDSHADSPVVGKYATVLEESGKRVHVSGFTKSLGNPLSVPVVTAAVAYDCDITGDTHILVICNALYLDEMEVNLIPPMMMRLAGIKVDECPKFLSDNPSEENHSAFFEEFGIRIPFLLDGIISYIPTRKPSTSELKANEGNYLLLTPNTPSWDPHSDVYQDQELRDGRLQW